MILVRHRPLRFK